MTIAELRALLARATPGPWHLCDDGETSKCADESGLTTAHTKGCHAPHRKNAAAHAALIAAAINALPALLDAVEAAQRWMRTENADEEREAVAAFDAAVARLGE